jgi:L-2,4-diaminobutyrate decarboxylase
VCSDQTHYCVDRAARVMGLGDEGVIVVPTDDALQLRGAALAEALDDAARRGLRVFAVVASAGATAAGTFDPLDELADVCTARGVWLHVDGAHGASALFSAQHRHRLAGVARADSLVWDAHKLLLVPSLATAVLYRDGHRTWEAFAQEASYLFAGNDPRARWFDLGTRTLECTKPNLALDLYAILAVHGPGLLAAHVDRTTALAAALADRIEAAPDFRLAVRPATNIVCFRVEPESLAGDADALDALQDAVRDALVRDGGFYLVRTRLRGRTWLRTTLMSPYTQERDLDALLEAVRACATRLAQR